jgi:hypothetical protein
VAALQVGEAHGRAAERDVRGVDRGDVAEIAAMLQKRKSWRQYRSR